MIDNFRDIMSEVPTGVGVITCIAPEGVIGCTISSVISVSVEANDEKILFALKKSSHIGKILRQRAQFTLSILSDNQEEVAKSAGGSLKHIELISFLENNIESDSNGGFPIKGSRIAFSLLVDQVFETSSSDIYLCKVQSAKIYGELKGRPLLYFRREFKRIEESGTKK